MTGTRDRGARLAPLVFVAGMTLMAAGLAVLSLAATDEGHTTFHATSITQHNGTAWLAYAIPVGFGDETALHGSFRFPETQGVAMVLGCEDYDLVRQGLPPTRPSVVSHGVSGRFSVTEKPFGAAFGGPAFCSYRFVVFQWAAADGNLQQNRPEVQLQLRSSLLTTSVGVAVIATTLAGAALALGGGLAWGRRVNQAVPAGIDESTAETLLVVLHRSGAWLERTRRSLLLAGIFGIFLWYPVLLPWAWNLASDSPSPNGWLVPLGCVVLLGSLTLLWAREFLRLDRELVAWRKRMDRLVARESAFLDS